MAGNKGHVGSSPFTHQDDAVAPVHTTDPNHQDAHIYGGNVPPKQELQETVLGPAAFGSPDPRTLGHIMLPLREGQPVSAPELDPEFEKLRDSTYVGTVTEDQLNDMTKDELLTLAQTHGIDVNTSMTKQEIIDTIFDEKESTQWDGADVQEGADAQNQGQADTANQNTNYEEWSKDDLLNEAHNRNLGVNTSNSKDELITALEESDQSSAQQ